jgi:hypothetical protein
MLRRHFGPEIGIVFIGPCIAKKLEATAHPELLDAALTFEDLRRWFEAEKLDLARFEAGVEDGFVPEGADEGDVVPGGWRNDSGYEIGLRGKRLLADGIFWDSTAIEKAITGLGAAGWRPAVSRVAGLRRRVCERSQSRQTRRHGSEALPRLAPGQAERCEFAAHTGPGYSKKLLQCPCCRPKPPEAQVREALKLVGKFSHEDELDCGGCGYNSCREFALALIGQKAERSMCVTYMRKLALKKANALIQKMPSAVVIVNDAMRIIEYATPPSRKCSAGPATDRDALLEGVMLSEVMPFASLFHSVLKTGEEIMDRDLRYQNTILHTSIFTIEKHCVIGAILQDITEPAVRKQQVIRKAQEVIQRSLTTTQEIARLLGESAAETEITLNSIIDSFTPEKPEEPKVDNDWRKLYRR